MGSCVKRESSMNFSLFYKCTSRVRNIIGSNRNVRCVGRLCVGRFFFVLSCTQLNVCRSSQAPAANTIHPPHREAMNCTMQHVCDIKIRLEKKTPKQKKANSNLMGTEKKCQQRNDQFFFLYLHISKTKQIKQNRRRGESNQSSK